MPQVTCKVCKGPAYTNSKGQVLMHTITIYSKLPPRIKVTPWGPIYEEIPPTSEVCDGSTPGARP